MSLIKLANDISEYEYYSKEDPLNAVSEYNYRDNDLHAVNVQPEELNDAFSLYGARTEDDPVGALEVLQHGDPLTQKERNLQRAGIVGASAAGGAGLGLSARKFPKLNRVKPLNAAIAGGAALGGVGGALADKLIDRVQVQKAQRVADRINAEELDDIYQNHATDYMG